jgi:glycosyltransferase involved in cell wall biosynthesis
MTFDGRYLQWNQARIKFILDFYGGHTFFYNKTMLDLGCGHGDISGAFYRLGSQITAVDARPDHLAIANKKFPGIKIIKADLDQDWPFQGQKFDIVLDLALLCHLRDYEKHLINICNAANYVILETAVCDSDDPTKCILGSESKGIYDNSINGVSSRPTTAAIERILTNCGMSFRRMDNARLNSSPFVYDWQPQNNGDTSIGKRRLWFANKTGNIVQTVQPAPAYNLTGGNGGSGATIQNSHSPAHGQSAFHAIPRHPQSPYDNSPIPVTAQIQQTPLTQINYTGPSTSGDKKFVVVIPSYKNSQWCIQNITSALNQNYSQYRIIFTDDCSPDDTFSRVSDVVNSSSKGKIVTLIKNGTRLGALHNLYNMIHSCQDDEIILTLDGDDWFPDDNVLNKLNTVYSGDDIYITYGQYKNSNDGSPGVAQPYPQHVIDSNTFRHHVWGASHLRTFYTWLFKRIKKEDLMKDGKFFVMTWDMALMWPMLEMAGNHSKYLSDILYVYNLDNPINDHKVNITLQHSLDAYIRGMPKYSRTTAPEPILPPSKTNIGLLLIATGKYDRFIQGLVSSADKYFFNDTYNITYYVFTDTNNQIQSTRNIVTIPTEHKVFPYASMDRFRHFTKNSDKLNKEDYLYYVDVDCLFADNISSEILGNLVGVKHCGYINKEGTYENNPKSTSYVEPNKRKIYFGGGFSGGITAKYLELSLKCADDLDIDINNGIIPIYHDESILNKYFVDHPPDIILSPSYHYPQGNIEYYKAMWQGQDFKPKILLLDKNHQEIRS